MSGNEMVIVSDYAGEDFAKKVARKLECPYIHTNITYFSDGEPDIQVTKNIRGREVFYICPFQPKPVQRFTEITLVNSTLRDSSATKIIDVPTYLGFMKKHYKDRARVPISIRAVAENMELYADSFLTIDMHAKEIQGIFRKPFDHLDGTVLFAEHMKNNFNIDDFAIASPDVGGGGRAIKLAERTGAEQFAIIYKLRDPKTRKTKSIGIMGDVKDKNVIFVDDQEVSCESLEGAAKVAKEYGAKNIYAYATHGLMTEKEGITAEERIANSFIDKLFITDTVPREPKYFEENEKIELISCVDLFSKAIYRIHKNESLSESDLFN
jgi:ribose-phosphate pyrophosphokinase